MPKRALALLLTTALIASPHLVAAQAPDADLAAGIRQAEDGDYAAAVITLDRVARALAERRDRPHELARAYLYLGIAYVGLGSETSARARFRDALAQAHDLRLDPEQFPPKVIELFEKARDESRAPAPASAPTPAPRPAPKGKSKIPLVLIGVGGAAAAGIALAAGGGGGSAGSSGTSTPVTNARTEMIAGSVSGTCNGGSDTASHRIVPSASGTLEALLSWTDRDHPIAMFLGDSNNQESARQIAQSTPASNTSARMSAPVSNQAYWVFVYQFGGGPCVSYTLALTYPQ